MISYAVAVINIAALATLVAGAATKGWIILVTANLKAEIGIFWFTATSGETTLTGSTTNVNYFSYNFVEYKAEAVIAILLCVVATIFIIVYSCSDDRRWGLTVAIICNFLSVITALILIGRIISINEIFKSPNTAHIVKFNIPYSVIIFGVGGGLELMVMIVSIILVCKANKTEGRVHENPNSVGVANPQYSHAERGEAPSATYPGGHPTPNSYRMNTKSKADDNQNAKSTKKVKKVGGIAKTAGKVLGGFFGEALDGMDSDD